MSAQLKPPVCLKYKVPSAPSFALAPEAPSGSSPSHHSPSLATPSASISAAPSSSVPVTSKLSKSAKRRARRKAKQSQPAVKKPDAKQPDYMDSGEWGVSILTTPTTAPPNPREGEGVRKVLF